MGMGLQARGMQAAFTPPSSEDGMVAAVMTQDIGPARPAVDQNESKLRPAVELSGIHAQGDHGVADTQGHTQKHQETYTP